MCARERNIQPFAGQRAKTRAKTRAKLRTKLRSFYSAASGEQIRT